jgi:translocator protein
MAKLDNVFYVYLGVVLAVLILSWLMTHCQVRSEWYDNLCKPSIADERFLFVVVWLVIFTLMVVAGYYGDVAARAPGRSKKWINSVRILFGFQLLFNFLWSLFFFVFHQVFFAFIINILLVITLIALMVLYIQIAPISFWVLVPYLVWCIYALYLTLYILSCESELCPLNPCESHVITCHCDCTMNKNENGMGMGMSNMGARSRSNSRRISTLNPNQGMGSSMGSGMGMGSGLSMGSSARRSSPIRSPSLKPLTSNIRSSRSPINEFV